MPKVTEMTPLPPKILLYGRAGSGKTAFTYTLGAELQVLDLDRGWLTALKLKDKFTEVRQQVDVIPCHDERADVVSAFRKFKEHLMKVQAECYQKKYGFKYLAVDSLTSLGDAAVRYVLSNSGHLGKAPTLQEWGLAIMEIKNMLTVLYSLPIPVILIAHETREVVDEITKVSINVIGRQLPSDLPMYFDEIWYAVAEPAAGNSVTYAVQTRQSVSVLARSRAELPNNFAMNRGFKEALHLLGYLN